MSGDDRGIVLLPAEAAAQLQGGDPHLLAGQVEEEHEGGVHEVGALDGAADDHLRRPALLVDPGQDAVRLQVDVLLGARPVLALDDEGGAAPHRVRISPADAVLLQDVVRAVDDVRPVDGGLDVQHRRQLLHVQGHGPARLFREAAVRMGQQHD
ncbi:MAG TPA: hypothetical protein VN436_11415, partial [Holophaga sp.]|nr:hypothetical protein [Holophaga sp.]